MAGVTLLDRGDLLGGPHGDDPAAAGTSLGSEVNDPVSGFDDVEVVLDHDDGVSAVDQSLKDGNQLVNVVEMEPGGRLIQHIQGSTRRSP